MKKQTRPSSAPTPVRFSPAQIQLIEETADVTGMSRQDVIRLSVSAGIKILRRLGHDGMAELIADQHSTISPNPRPRNISTLPIVQQSQVQAQPKACKSLSNAEAYAEHVQKGGDRREIKPVTLGKRSN